MNDDRRDLAAGAALGVLSADEAAGLSAELDRDPALGEELGAYRATVSMLEASIARERSGYDLLPGILAEIEAAPSGAELGKPERVRARSWRQMLPAFALGAAATAAVFAIALSIDSNGALGTPDAVAAVQGTPEFTDVHGEAQIYDAQTSNGILRLKLADLPAAAPGEHYEVWVLRPSAGGAMEAVGVFNPKDAEVELELRLPGPGDYAAVDISVEPDAGSAEHSGTSLASGKFESGTT